MVVKIFKVLTGYFFVCSVLFPLQFHFCNDYNPYGFYTGVSLPEYEMKNFLKIDWGGIFEYSDRAEYVFYSDYGAGNLRLPFEPQRKSRNMLLFSGQKRIGSQDYFSGFFAYRHDLLWKKMWVHDRNPYAGVPFLLADSSNGDFELSGIICNFKITRDLKRLPVLLGLSVLYGVDEEIKKIFPRPQLKHRDLLVNVGVGYRFSKSVTFSLQSMYFDFQEISLTTRYDLEQNRTPIFFKIRGMDNPLVFRGQTSEERLKNLKGKLVELALTTNLVNISSSLETASAKVVDGGAYPVNQGSWSSVRYIVGSEAFINKGRNVCGKLYFRYHVNFQEATHPDLRVVTYRLKRECFESGMETEFRWLGFAFTVDIGGYYPKLKKTDIFNGDLHYFSYFVPSGGLKVEGFSVRELKFSFEGGLERGVLQRAKSFTEGQDWFYREISALEYKYLATDFLIYSLGWKASLGSYWFSLDSRWQEAGGKRKYMLQLSFGLAI